MPSDESFRALLTGKKFDNPDFNANFDQMTAAANPDVWQVYRDAKPGTVQVFREDRFGHAVAGSGFVVDGGKVVTDWHVINGARRVWVSHNGNRHEVDIKDIDDIEDLAILQLRTGKTSTKPLTLGESATLKRGDRIIALGHPKQTHDLVASPGTFNHRNLDVGVVVSLGGLQQAARQWNQVPETHRGDLVSTWTRTILDANVHGESGQSGGPLLDQSGAVVGVVCQHEIANTSHSFFTRSEKVRELLNRPSPKFEFDRGMKSNADIAPVAFVNTALCYGAALAGSQYFPKTASLGVMGYGAFRGMRDYNHISDCFDGNTKLNYQLSLASDVTMVSGSALSIASQAFKLNPRLRMAGNLLMAAGMLGSLATDLRPTHPDLIQGIRRTDTSDSRTPMSFQYRSSR